MSAEKDRQSRMASSSVNAPMKKGGEGAHTWGGAMDGQMEFQPHAHLVQPSITLAPAPVQQIVHVQSARSVNLGDASQFPSLGGTVPAPAPVSWGPTTVVQSPLAVLGENPIRQGVEFGPTHPRNQFARHAYHQPAAQFQVGVDWSSSGSAGFEQHYVNAHNNPAHLAPHQLAVQAAQPISSLSVGSYVVAPPVYVQQPPQVIAKHNVVPQYQKRQMMQGRGR
jgi:hypothetical protein